MIKLKEISFGTPIDDPDQTCIYTNGHIDRAEFLAAVKDWDSSDVPKEYRAELSESDVEHIRFRPMSPTEARSHGIDWGVMESADRGYKVTAVKL